MILCVTLNPCLDKTLSVPAWSPGDSVRGSAVREVVGGKGNNVARALRRLGHADAQPVTFLGGPVGRRCEELLGDEGMEPILVPTKTATREILTVRTEGSDAQTAFFDPDPAIPHEEADALIGAVHQALASGEVRGVAMSGSSPSPATHGVYSELIALANARAVPTFLDTYGPALRAIWGFWPTVVQMNLREAGIYLKMGSQRPRDTDVAALLERLASRGVRLAVVTDGPNRFLASIDGRVYRVAPPAIEPVNPIGSGDSLLAGLVDGWLNGSDPIANLRRAVGCAVANALVWDAGGFDPDEAHRIGQEVRIDAASDG